MIMGQLVFIKGRKHITYSDLLLNDTFTE